MPLIRPQFMSAVLLRRWRLLSRRLLHFARFALAVAETGID